MSRPLVLILVLLVLVPGVAMADWPMAKHDAQHTSISDTTLKPPLAVDWQKSIGGEAASSPTLYNGTLFEGNGNGKKLVALDAGTGAMLWEYATYAAVEATPAAANGSVIACSYDGFVYKLDAATGTLKWKFDAKSGIFSSPLIYNGHVYVGTDDGSFYAIDLQNGTSMWKLAKPTQSSPAGAGGKVYIGTLDGVFHALDAENGSVIWSYRTNDSFHSSPMVFNGTVYCAARNGTLYAFDAGSGGVRWTYDLGYNVDSTPSADPSTVYIGTYGGRVYAIERGTLKWASQFYGPIYQSVTISGDVLYGASQDGKLFALDRATGAGLWSYDLKEETFASPAIDGGRLYMATMGGNVIAFKESSAPVTPTPAATPKPAATPFMDVFACIAVVAVTAGLCRKSGKQ